MTYQEFLNRYDDLGEFNHSRESMIEAGWYDWFCTDRGLWNRLKKMMPCIRRLAKSDKIDLDKTRLMFKNNCPMWVNETYDDFRICNLETGDVMWTIAPRYPFLRDDAPNRRAIGNPRSSIKYMNEVWDFTLTEEEYAALRIQNLAHEMPIDYDECVVLGTRKDVYAYFGV